MPPRPSSSSSSYGPTRGGGAGSRPLSRRQDAHSPRGASFAISLLHRGQVTSGPEGAVVHGYPRSPKARRSRKRPEKVPDFRVHLLGILEGIGDVLAQEIAVAPPQAKHG